MALGTRVTTTTQDKILPKVVDTILGSNVLGARMLKKAKKWSGDKLKFPIKVSKNSTGSSFAGFDTFSTSATDNRVLLEFSPKFRKITVSLPLDELSANATEDKIIDLAKIEMASAAHDMADDIGTDFYADGTGNSSKNFLGFGAIIDDGSNVANYGGLSRGTYSTIQSTNTASGGTITLAKMATLYNAVSSGSTHANAGYTTETVFSLYEQLLTPQERYAVARTDAKSGLIGGTGYLELHYKGFPIMADEKATSQHLFFVNEDFLNFYALPVALTEPVKVRSADIEGNDYSEVEGLGFSWSGWIKPTNQAAVVSHIYLGGEFISENPKRHGKLTGITSV
jgi:hypothetical protein